MAVKRWYGDAAATKQAESNTVSDATPAAGETWTLTFTGEDGATATAVYTVVASDTETIIVAGLVSAVNNNSSAMIRRVTATGTTDVLTLTAATAGAPFTVAYAETAASGTWDGTSSVTANTGPNDWNTLENWSSNTLPVADDDIRVPGDATASILYGLQVAIAFDDFVVEEGYAGTIGGTDSGYLTFTQGASDRFEFAGTGQAWIDIGASDVDPVIDKTYTPPAGQFGLSLKATALSDIYLNRGNLGFGIDADDTTSEVDIIHMSYITNKATDSTLTVGEGVTDTAGTGDPDVTMHGGKAYCWANMDVVQVLDSSAIYRQEKGLWATMTCAGTCRPNDTGTHATTTLKSTGKLLNDESSLTKTFTDLTLSDGCEVRDRRGLITWTNAWDIPDDFMGSCIIDIGFNKKIAVTDS